MRKVLSLAVSTWLVSGSISILWVVGVIGQRPYIPVQTPEVSYVDIILHRKKLNPIDDLYLPVLFLDRIVDQE